MARSELFEDKYNREELVKNLQELADIFVESEEEDNEFMLRAERIVFCYDYLLERLKISEVARFGKNI